MKILKQLGLILLLNFTGDAVSLALKLPIPGSILAMAILLTLLKVKAVKEEQIKELSDFVLSNITFFFIPIGVSIMAGYKYMEGHYLQCLAIIVITTVSVILAAALVTAGVTKIKSSKK